MEIVYSIGHLPDGPNYNKRGSRQHGWMMREASRKCKDVMRDVIAQTPRPSLYPLEHLCEVEIIVYMPTRHNRDVFNMPEKCKPYLDTLIEQGVIVDDGWKVFSDGRVRLRLRPKWPGFDIVLRCWC